MRLFYTLSFALVFLLGTSTALATGPRECDMNGTECETYADPYWDKPAEEPSKAPEATAPASPVSVSAVVPERQRAVIRNEQPVTQPDEPVTEVAAPSAAKPAVQVAAAQADPLPEPKSSSHLPILGLIAAGLLAGILLRRLAD